MSKELYGEIIQELAGDNDFFIPKDKAELIGVGFKDFISEEHSASLNAHKPTEFVDLDKFKSNKKSLQQMEKDNESLKQFILKMYDGYDGVSVENGEVKLYSKLP